MNDLPSLGAADACGDAFTTESNWDTQLTPTPNRRRLQSVESHESDSSKAPSVGCSDSGHYSSANVSDVQPDTGWQDLLHQKDQALFVALQDVRRLRSELERLSKSERWYKQELRTQKHSRLEALEKLYTNERNYMQENQRLQRECIRLYGKCSEVEHELEEQREHELRKQKHASIQLHKEQSASGIDQEFENVQQRALIVDQQQLIDVLRKQKRALLGDLKRLNDEKDAKIYELQKTLAELEEDNQRITKKCKSLLDERSALVTALTEKASALELSKTAHASLQVMAKETQAHAETQQHELEIKEREIMELQCAFKQTLQNEHKADEVHRLSVEFHQQLTQKTAEIAALKNSLNVLQQDLNATEDLHTQNEEQQRDLEQLRSLLEEKDFELTKLQDFDAKKISQIMALKAEIDEYQSLTRTMEQSQQQNVEQLLNTQETLQRTQLELIALNEKYANMCALCERTKFELEIREIESRKLQYEKQKDTEEIVELREKLAAYLQQTEHLSSRINELESELSHKQQEKEELLLDNELFLNNEQEHIQDKINVSQLSEGLKQEDEDFKNLNTKLLEMNEYIEKLGAENGALKDFIKNRAPEVITHDFLEDEYNNLSIETKSNDFTLLNSKFQQTHVFLQHMQNENKVLKALVEESTNASLELLESETTLQSLVAENHKLKLQLKNTLEGIQQKCAANNEESQILNAKLQENAIALERLSNENHELNTEILEHTKIKAENIKINNKLTASLATTKTEVKELQLKLLKNDAKLYKLEKLKNQLEAAAKDDEKYLAIKQKNKKLLQELENLHATQVRLENELKKKDLQIVSVAKLEEENIQLRQKLQEIEETANELNLERVARIKELAAATNQESHENDNTLLIEKVAMLEQQLQQTLNINEQQKAQRIELLNRLLEQQNQKVAQLHSTQSDWEELLKTLNETQALEANTRDELECKRAELEELNELFSEQNDDMQKLQELMLFQENERQEVCDNMQQTFRKKIVMIQQQVTDSEMKNAEQSKLIEDLQLKNLRLKQDIDENFATEVAENKKELRLLHKQVAKLNNERSEIASRMQEMEDELMELRRNKREAMIVPQIVFPSIGSDIEIIEITDESHINNNNNIPTDDHMRILSKVLESEHQRKMARYDLHIRALLNNVKSLKHSLAVEEQKVYLLQEQQEQTIKDLKEFQSTKGDLLETRQRFKQAQKMIKTLEQQLVLMRTQYESTDSGKSKRQEPTHEVANLIDDYKKLIQQSAAATNRPRTSAIVDLIERSNQCVPNLNKLESSVQELHNDIQQFISNQHTQSLASAYTHVHKVPSLMDELKAATELALT